MMELVGEVAVNKERRFKRREFGSRGERFDQ